MARVDQTITAHLDANVAGLTLATNLFNGPLQANSGLAVFCTINGGEAPRMHLGPTYEQMSNVRVIVRSAPDKYGPALDMAQTVWENLHAQILDADWADMLMLESEPQYLGQDDENQHLWQMTARVEQNATL
jgi:hypothetical protein